MHLSFLQIVVTMIVGMLVMEVARAVVTGLVVVAMDDVLLIAKIHV